MSRGTKHKKSGIQKHPNSHAREVAMQALYQIDLTDQPIDEALRLGWLNAPMEEGARRYCDGLVRKVEERRAEIDERIKALSHKDITQISSVNRTILRMGIVELDAGLMDAGIIIDDLLNLTRRYDGEESVAFINGILDTHLKRPPRESQD